MNRRRWNLWIELIAIGLILGSLFVLALWIYFKGIFDVMSLLPDESNRVPAGTGLIYLSWLAFAAGLTLVAWSLRFLLRDD